MQPTAAIYGAADSTTCMAPRALHIVSQQWLSAVPLWELSTNDHAYAR